MAPPSLDDNWAFEARFTVEQPVTKRGMENLDESVPHGACWCNVRYLGADSFDATLKRSWPRTQVRSGRMASVFTGSQGCIWIAALATKLGSSRIS